MPSFYNGDYFGRFHSSPDYHGPFALNQGVELQRAPPFPYGPVPGLLPPPTNGDSDYSGYYGRLAAPLEAPTVKPPTAVSQRNDHDVTYVPGAGGREHCYGPVGAPVFPSGRPLERLPGPDAIAPRHYPLVEHPLPRQVQSARDEKLGGVSAHLDYEMDQMSEFVATMAQEIVHASAPVSPAFRKFVSQILSSTRLPSSTIILALHYLAKRMSFMPVSSPDRTGSPQVYRFLTVALLLGSKFLDDNTFQNRSWSDVSGLSVAELNGLEKKWLIAVDWKLHVDMSDTSSRGGFVAMLENWRAWTAKANRSRLAPLDTSVARRSSYYDSPPASRSAMSYTHPHSAHFGSTGIPLCDRHPQHHYPHYLPQQLPTPQHAPLLLPGGYRAHPWEYSRTPIDYSPPSAPETSPNTPQYPSFWGAEIVPAAGYPAHHIMQAALQKPLYHPPSYPQHLSAFYSGHPVGCACAYCLRSRDPHFMRPVFAPQSVVG